MHAGSDFAAPDGTPFYACAGGTIIAIGHAQGYGQWILIDHPETDGGGVTEYGHMWDAFATGLKLGQRVEAGQLLGYVGSNGQSTGPHLHLSVMPKDYNPSAKIDPAVWLRGAGFPSGTPTKGGSGVNLTVDLTILTEADDGKRDPNKCQAIVFHTNQGPETGSVRSLLEYCTDIERGVSYNIIVGAGQIGRSNDDNYIPWSAGPTANRAGLHVCLLGYAEQTRAQWLDPEAMLDRAARVAAFWSQEYGIPLVRIDAAALKAGKRGVCGHVDTAQAWGETNHTDPGDHFPYDVVLTKARALLGQTTGEGPLMALTDAEQREILEAVRAIKKASEYSAAQLGPGDAAWGKDGNLGKNDAGKPYTVRAALADSRRRQGFVK